MDNVNEEKGKKERQGLETKVLNSAIDRGSGEQKDTQVERKKDSQSSPPLPLPHDHTRFI